MKKNSIKYIFLIVLVALFASACEKQLDNKPYAYMTSEFTLDTEDGINGLLLGVYNLMSDSDYYGRQIYAYEASKGPDFFVRRSSGGRFEIENRYAEGALANGRASGTWLQIYLCIRNATILLENIDKIEGDKANLARIKGEAHALRGLCYFDLMRMFAYAPYYSCSMNGTNPNYNLTYKWGVALIKDVETSTKPYNHEILRSTADESYAYIESDLLAAKELLATAAPIQGQINYCAVCGILSRMYLYLGNWEKVVENGEDALLAAQGTYSMIPYDLYKSSYYNPFNTENIWEFSYSISDNLSSDCLSMIFGKETYNIPGAANDGQVKTAVGYSAFGLQKSAIKLLTSNVNDVRSYLKCDLGITGKEYYGCRKYIGSPYHYVHNVPVIRLPEIYLNLAEAYAELDNSDKANEYYKAVRFARTNDNSGFTNLDTNTMLKETLEERRRELILEGHTYWDYFRRGTTFTRERMENVSYYTVVFTNINKPQVVYPIPRLELDANVPMREQQNPGYASYVDELQ